MSRNSQRQLVLSQSLSMIDKNEVHFRSSLSHSQLVILIDVYSKILEGCSVLIKEKEIHSIDISLRIDQETDRHESRRKTKRKTTEKLFS